MKTTVDQLKQFNSDDDNDQLVAAEFCKEALVEIKQRINVIEHICNLGQILDADVLLNATNALAGIRHLTLSVESVAESHQGNQLGTVFGRLHADFDGMRERAEANYRWLCMLFPSHHAEMSALKLVGK